MSKKRKRLSAEALAHVIEGIAARVESRDESFAVQMEIQSASAELMEMRHVEGLRLLNRVALLQLTAGSKGSQRYRIVEETIARMPPLDPEGDGVALRELAKDIRRAADIGPHA